MEYMTADTKVNGYMVYPRFLSTIGVSPTRENCLRLPVQSRKVVTKGKQKRKVC